MKGAWRRGAVVPHVCAGSAVVASCLVTAGWLLGVSPLVRPDAGGPSMTLPTAISLGACGVALGLRARRRGPRTATSIASVVAILAAITFIGAAAGFHFGLEMFFTAGAAEPLRSTIPPAAISLLLLGWALRQLPRARRPWFPQVAALTVAFISVGAAVGYLFGVEELFQISSDTALAPHTAVVLLILSVGVLFLQQDYGIARVILDETFGGRIARRLLPATVVAPIIVGWMILQGERAGLYQTTLGLALEVLITMTLLSSVVWLSARVISAMDVQRREADAALILANEALESRVAEKTSALVRSQEKARAAEEQLRAGQRLEAMGQLAGSIAHDVSNMMTVVTGYSGVLLSQLGPTHELHHSLQEIKKAADRCSALTRRLLAFSRRQILTPIVLNLGETLTDLNNMLPMIVGDDVTVAISQAPDLWHVRVDRAQMEQVIVNLVVNARDAMPSGGTLALSTANVEITADREGGPEKLRPGDYVRLTVTDSGVGMSPSTLARVFDPFFTTKPPGEGTGLGLSIAYGVIAQSGGHIEVESALGQGTTFQIYLPRVKSALASAAVARFGTDAGFETLLLVEDDDGVRELFRFVLGRAGYLVLDAADGERALEVASEHAETIHLLISDVVMPGIGGAELAARLCSLRPGLRVLLISGYPRPDLERPVPHQSFLQKPVTPELLLSSVRKLLDTPGRIGGTPGADTIG